MNVAASRMLARGRDAMPAARFNPFAAAERSSLYDQIVHSIGDDAADKLIADFGGRRLYIPIAPGPGDLISRSIGLLPALAMARTFGSDRLLIPVSSDHARRRVRIIALRAENVSISRIARELRCTERYVYKVLAVCRAPEAQLAHSSPPPPSSYDCSPSLEGKPVLSLPKEGRGSGSTTSAPLAERFKRGRINQHP